MLNAIEEVSFSPSLRLLEINRQNEASLTPNKCNHPLAPTENPSIIGGGEASGAITFLPPHLIDLQTPQNTDLQTSLGSWASHQL
jgi:hypothetical protein